MKNFIKYLNINNFKSIANLELKDCRRINLFIGYPNVGKSNVLEALGLFSLPYLDEGENLNKLVRVENMNELLHNLSDTFCKIETDLEKIELSMSSSLKIYREISNGKVDYIFSKELDLLDRKVECYDCNQDEYCADSGNIMRYIFQSENNWKSSNCNLLLPPYGENVVSVLARDVLFEERIINEWIENELKKNNLEYVLDMSDHTIKSQKRLGAGRVFTFPYSLFADTLQRVIFYKTAIASNKNAILLFEEPEAHAFPPYIKNITQDIIDAKTNQFFIVTHSPFIVNGFLEYADLRQEVAIYLFGFKNDQTIVKRLTDEEINEVYSFGIDLFFNIESYLRDE
jgi:AAA15 family ATPase/GTPase